VFVCAAADARHDALSQLSSSESRCPFGGNGSTSLPNQDMARPSAPDGGNPLNLSVSFPPREYLPFKDEAYKIDLRFDRITPDDIFEIDEEYEADMKRKSHILATRPAELLLPGVPGVWLATIIHIKNNDDDLAIMPPSRHHMWLQSVSHFLVRKPCLTNAHCQHLATPLSQRHAHFFY